MDFANGLSQQQEQKLTLAPQQLASLSLLTLPLAELQNRIEQEMAQNPVLEIREDEPVSEDPESAVPDISDDAAGGDEEPLDPNREDYEEHLDRLLSSENPGSDSAAEDKRQFMFDSLVAELVSEGFFHREGDLLVP